jgi:hypothetical protein
VLPRNRYFPDLHSQATSDEQALDIESARDARTNRTVRSIGRVYDELIEHGQQRLATPRLESALGIGERETQQNPAQEHLSEAEDIPLRRGARPRHPAAADRHIRTGPGRLEQEGASLDWSSQVHVRQQHDLAPCISNSGAQGGCLASMSQLEHAVGRVESEGDRIVDASIVRDDQFGGERTSFQPGTHHLEHAGLDGRALVIGWNYDRQRNQDALSSNDATWSDRPGGTHRA